MPRTMFKCTISEHIISTFLVLNEFVDFFYPECLSRVKSSGTNVRVIQVLYILTSTWCGDFFISTTPLDVKFTIVIISTFPVMLSNFMY